MDRLLSNASPPLWDKLLDTTGMLVDSWRSWFGRMPDTLEAIPSRWNYVSLSNQIVSIATTDYANGSLLHGLYRMTYYARLVSPGGSGTLSVYLSWTDGGVLYGFQGATLSLAAEETSTTKSESLMVRIDKGTAISYATTYDELGTYYNLDLTLEKMKVLT